MTEFDFCLVKLDKNKDKNTKKTNPFAYVMEARIQYPKLTSLTFSTLADNFFLTKAQEQLDFVLENRKKTEIIATLKRVSPKTTIQFSDVFNIELKKKKKATLQFLPQQDAAEGGLLKGKNVRVPPGIGKEAYPNLKEPQKVTHTRTTYKPEPLKNDNISIDIPNNNGPPNRGPGRQVPPPRNLPNTGNDGDTGRLPPGRLPPRNSDMGGTGRLPPPRRDGPPGRVLPGRLPPRGNQ